MKNIRLTNGDFAIVSDVDYEYLNTFKWSCKQNKHTKYAYRCGDGSRCIWMHREVLGISNDKSKRGDHIDFNGLNNQRENLRIATHKQNNCYKQSAKSSTSKYLGVSLCKATGKWRATTTENYKQVGIGRFSTQIEAALAYNYMAFFLHGEFANLNQLPIT